MALANHSDRMDPIGPADYTSPLSFPDLDGWLLLQHSERVGDL